MRQSESESEREWAEGAEVRRPPYLLHRPITAPVGLLLLRPLCFSQEEEGERKKKEEEEELFVGPMSCSCGGDEKFEGGRYEEKKAALTSA